MNLKNFKAKLQEVSLRSFILGYISLLFVFTIIALPTFYFVNDSKDRIYTIDSVPKEYTQNIMVLGAGIDGEKPGDYLVDRLATAAELHKEYGSKRIILSGDNGEKYHYQTDVMHETLIEEYSIPEHIILDDPLGYRTYDSCARLKEVYGIEKVTVVTQSFHQYRAVTICNRLGIDTVGVVADLRSHYKREWIYSIRELFARHKALIDLFVWEPSYSTDLAQ